MKINTNTREEKIICIYKQTMKDKFQTKMKLWLATKINTIAIILNLLFLCSNIMLRKMIIKCIKLQMGFCQINKFKINNILSITRKMKYISLQFILKMKILSSSTNLIMKK